MGYIHLIDAPRVVAAMARMIAGFVISVGSATVMKGDTILGDITPIISERVE